MDPEEKEKRRIKNEGKLPPTDPLKMNLRQLLASYKTNMMWNDMDEVFPGLFLGGVDAAKNADRLKAMGVTHVVNSSYTTKQTFSALGVGTSEEYYHKKGHPVRFLGLPAVDISGFRISQYFDEATDFIHSALDGGRGKVLVHCFMGVSRSATLVLSYLMMKHNMTAPQALQHVKAKRNIHPNEGFIDQLCHLHRRLHEPCPLAIIAPPIHLAITDNSNSNPDDGTEVGVGEKEGSVRGERVVQVTEI